MATLPTDLHLYSETVGLVQHAQWCLWADPLTQSEQVGERPRLRVEHIDSGRVARWLINRLPARRCAGSGWPECRRFGCCRRLYRHHPSGPVPWRVRASTRGVTGEV